jgi:hypothetical protein
LIAVPGTRLGIPETSPGLGAVVVLVDVEGGDAMTGIVGSTVLGPTVPTIGDTLGVGIAAEELTPRLAISQESSGIPVRAAPPGVVGAVDVGVDDDAMLLAPVPHIPDNPTVPIVPAVVDIPEICSIPGSVDMPEIADTPDDIPAVSVLPDVAVVPPDIAVVPAVAAVAVVADPIVIPPPS